MNSHTEMMTLPNGLTLITEERHTAPVISFWVGYKVGSIDERPGQTGIAHWIEHMLFKPTTAFPGTERDRLVSREGGIANAFTWCDGTAYFATLRASAIDLLIEIEADRMANSQFDPIATEVERTVILAEHDQSENSPAWRLNEQVMATLYPNHPYGHEPIGLRKDLETLTRDELYAFYQSYYTPSNAIAVAVGSFDTADIQDRIAKHFEPIPRRLAPSRSHPTEPPQAAEQRITLRGVGGVALVQMCYRGLRVGDSDFIPAAVLVSLLGGSFNLVMESISSSHSSRLYRELVEGELAIEVKCTMEATIDPYALDISAAIWNGRTHSEVEAAIDRVIENIVTHPVPEAELARAKKQMIASFVYSNERISHRALVLTHTHLALGTELVDTYDAQIAAVTAEDVQRVAARLFKQTNRVVGYYIPTD